MKISFYKWFLISGILSLFWSCKTSGPGIFGKKTLHESYWQNLEKAGLHKSAMGKKWFEAAERSLVEPLSITIPYKESGFFDASEPSAVGLRFPARQGEKIQVTLRKIPDTAFQVFLDLWQSPDRVDAAPKLLQSADSIPAPIEYEIRKDGNYQLRIQPELLKDGEYSIEIVTGPSLAYPISAPGNNHIRSFWGAARDGGSRSHEGLDLFAARKTPLVAAADGIITRVNQNNLGGKVVWMRPSGKDFSLYYAHLDSQLVRDGQRVKMGDTIGLMGNTGNARTTPPHLHFGIYTSRGAIDPLPFINPVIKKPATINAAMDLVGKPARIKKTTRLYSTDRGNQGSYLDLKSNTPVKILAATSNRYKIILPDGSSGFIAENAVHHLSSPIRNLTIKAGQPLFSKPDLNAPKKSSLEEGSVVSVLGEYDQFYLIRNGDSVGWTEKSK